MFNIFKNCLLRVGDGNIMEKYTLKKITKDPKIQFKSVDRQLRYHPSN